MDHVQCIVKEAPILGLAFPEHLLRTLSVGNVANNDEQHCVVADHFEASGYFDREVFTIGSNIQRLHRPIWQAPLPHLIRNDCQKPFWLEVLYAHAEKFLSAPFVHFARAGIDV